jgi:hypothetical protein
MGGILLVVVSLTMATTQDKPVAPADQCYFVLDHEA